MFKFKSVSKMDPVVKADFKFGDGGFGVWRSSGTKKSNPNPVLTKLQPITTCHTNNKTSRSNIFV